jgi:hypothetical protein
MAASLDNIQKLIDEINKTLKSSQGKITADAKEYVKQFKDVDAAAKSLELTMKGIRQTQLETNTGLNDLRERFNDIGKELNKQDFLYKSMYKSFSKIVSYADDLFDIQYDLASSSLKETKGLQNKVNLEFNRLKNQAKYLEQQINSDKLQGKELDKAKELLNFALDEVKALEEKVGYQDQFNKSLNETYKRQQRVHNAIGITGKLIGGLGGLLEKVGFDDFGEEIRNAKDQMGNLAIQITNNGEKAAGFAGTMKVGLAGLKSLGKSIATALSDPLVIFTILYKTIKGLIDLTSEFAKGVSNVGKAFGIAGKNAEETYMTIQKSQDLYHFPDELLEGQKKYNEAVGFNLAYNKENAALMQDLTHYLGLSDEQAGKLVKRSRILGQNFNDMDKDMVGITNNFNKQNKTAVPYAKVAEQISKVSASTAFNIKGGAKGLAEAAVVAARYGREMDDITNSAKQLLNFEDSISNEIEAELLTGKDLNLEKLRYAALTGDAVTQAKEQERLVKENFKNLKGNVLAQDAFAKSIGMTTEDVAKMVEQQQIEADILKKEGVAGLQRHQNEIKAQAEQAKAAEATDRAFKSAVMQLKTALLPLIQKITPFFITMAESVSSIAKMFSGGVGKTLLMVAGGVGAVYAGSKMVKGIGNLFSEKGKLGSSKDNAMYVEVTNPGEGGGGGEDKMGDLLEGKLGGKFGKLSKVLKTVSTILPAAMAVGGNLLQNKAQSKMEEAQAAAASGNTDKAKQLQKSAQNYQTAGESMSQTGEKGIFSQVISGAKGYVTKGINIASEQLGKLNPTKAIGTWLKSNAGKFLNKILKFPVIGTLIEGYMSNRDIKNMIADKNVSKEALSQAVGKRTMEGLGGVLGSIGGAALGSLIPVPGVGTFLGGMAGDFAGRWLAGAIADNVGAKPIGDAVLNLYKDELKDAGRPMATGGIVTGPTRALIGEAGPEAVIPLSQLMNEFKEMKQILRAILHKEGTITLNGTKMGTAMAVGSYKVQ